MQDIIIEPHGLWDYLVEQDRIGQLDNIMYDIAHSEEYGTSMQNVDSYTDTGFTSVNLTSSSNGVFRRFTIDLQKVFGTTNVTINSITVGGNFKISKSRTSYYYAKQRYYATTKSDHTATLVKSGSQVINTTLIAQSLTATSSEFNFNNYHFISTETNTECIEVAVNVYVYASSSYNEVLTAEDCYCTIDYTPYYGDVTFDSIFNYLKEIIKQRVNAIVR